MTVEREEHRSHRWPPSVEIVLDGLGRLLASVGLLVAILGGLLVWDGADRSKVAAWTMLIGGASACVSGLVMWGLASVIVELRRIRSLLEDRRSGRP